MERQFNNGDFENLLRGNANQYRMYPSEKVWKGIHSALHTRRKWYGIMAGIVFLLTGSAISVFIFNNTPETDVLIETKSASEKSNKQNQYNTNRELNHYTPELQKTDVNNSSLADITRSYIYNPLYDVSPSSKQSDSKLPDIAEAARIEIAQSFTQIDELTNLNYEQLPVAISETNIALGVNNMKAEITGQESGRINKEKSITDQSSLNDETETKIKDAISAIASQNAVLAPKSRRARVTGQVYFTPTVSYRKLSENKNIYNNRGYNVPSIDVKNLVKHKPAMGVEFGFEARYEASEKLFIKSGLQFNLNRYDIRAYSYPTEIATVAVSNGYRVDSIEARSQYRNFYSNSPANWLENFYFQVGIPVGVDVILSDRNNFQWGVSGTIQPTYVLGDRAYLISSDFKNYAKFPDLMRRWNISTGLGTFVSYSTGKIKWQVGPHVRYQHLSSFVSALAVKENLFAIGFKVGASLNNNKK